MESNQSEIDKMIEDHVAGNDKNEESTLVSLSSFEDPGDDEDSEEEQRRI
tara:strand:+ start:598 stop:747 length:150 start_codon:yes stop_codon:yes gene_type:complete